MTIPTATLGFSTTASSQKVSTSVYNIGQQPEIAIWPPKPEVVIPPEQHSVEIPTASGIFDHGELE